MTKNEKRRNERKRKILEFIVKHKSTNGYAPTVREICSHVGIKSTSTVFSDLKEIRRDGMIDFEDTKPRSITFRNENPEIVKLMMEMCEGRSCKTCELKCEDECIFSPLINLVESKQFSVRKRISKPELQGIKNNEQGIYIKQAE